MVISNFTILCVVVLFVNNCIADRYGYYGNDNREPDKSQYCADLDPEANLDIRRVFGRWYANQLIVHKDGNNGLVLKDFCISIHLTETSEKFTDSCRKGDKNSRCKPATGNNRFLRLIWIENNVDYEYTLKYFFADPGLWILAESKRGKSPQRNRNLLTGTVQVIKIVGNHLVLTFCEERPNSKVFSIAFSRDRDALSIDDLKGIQSILKRRGLVIKTFRNLCENHSAKIFVSFTLIILSYAFTFM